MTLLSPWEKSQGLIPFKPYILKEENGMMNNKYRKKREEERATKKREIDIWFEEIEKNPFLGMPDGFDRNKFLKDCAEMEKARIRRELTVVEAQLNNYYYMLSETQSEIMYDPLYSEMGVSIMKNIMTGISLFEDLRDQMKEDLLVLGYDLDSEDENGGYFE